MSPRYCSPTSWISLIVLTSVIGLPTSLSAQERKNLHFERLSTNQGLSQAVVNSILQDHHGYLWFGTQEGLNRYNGYDFVIFFHDPDDPRSLSHDSVRSIYEDRTGTLWVGTDGGGLNRFDETSQTFKHFKNDPANRQSLSSNRVRAITEDQQGSLWVGTEGGGLNRFDRRAETFQRFENDPSNPESLSDDRVTSLYGDRHGNLWIGTDGGGLNRFDAKIGVFTRFQHAPKNDGSLSGDRVRSLHQDREGDLWVGTYEGGLNRFDPTTRTFTDYLDLAEPPIDHGLVAAPDRSLYGFTLNSVYHLSVESVGKAPEGIALEEIARREGDYFLVAGPVVGKEILFASNHRLMAIQIAP